MAPGLLEVEHHGITPAIHSSGNPKQGILPSITTVEVPITPTEEKEDTTSNQVTTTSQPSPKPLQQEYQGPLLSASLITEDFDALRFNAAASLQLLPHPQSSSLPTSHFLISSPYNHPSHLLDLRRLTTQSRLLSLALTHLQPIRPDYATADYLSSFNWDSVLAQLRDLAKAEGHVWKQQEFYTVIFRSHLNEGIDKQWLSDLDQNSHREATESGGLLKYWFGAADAENRNLATCIWHSKEDARLGGLGPEHKKARMAARELYKDIRFSVWNLVVEDGAKGLRLEEWKG